MAGNERKIAEFLLQNKGVISLPHVELVTDIGNIVSGKYKPITHVEHIDEVMTEDAKKKADIYINQEGVSVKQSGGSFSFNRLQRANILGLLTHLNITNPNERLTCLDQGVADFHTGAVLNRNRDWQDFFNEDDFKILLNYLMMIGSPNHKNSSNPATYILTGPANGITMQNIKFQTFDEYFNDHKNYFKIAIRRQWVGQASKSEHKRALGFTKKVDNAPWVFNNVAGAPDSGWQDAASWDPNKRKTAYFLMIELINH